MSEKEAVKQPSGKSSFRWTTIIMWSGLIGLLAILGWRLVDINATRPGPGEMAPTFTMEFYDGYEWEGRDSAALADLEGKIIVVNFWASWCIECRLEADLLEQAWRDYRDQDVVFIGIAYVDTDRNAHRYLEEFNITYPNAPDLRTAISKKYQITGVPETFFIGRDGRVTDFIIGPLNHARLYGTLDRLLAES